MPLDPAYLRGKQAAYRRLFFTNKPKLPWWKEVLATALPGRILRPSFLDLNPDARVVVEDLMKFCRVGVEEYSNDPLELARAAGRREVALNLLHILNVDLVEAIDNAQNEEM